AAAAVTSATVCLADLRPERLDTLFDTEPGGVVGVDYQRALALPDGRVLWTFQDAAIRIGGGNIVIVHNIAAVQDGNCFTVRYGGSRAAPRSMFFADRTTPFERWFWPLDAAVGDDGRVYVFAAEMEERGDAYLTHTVPVGTWVAVFDPASDTVVDELRPPDSSADLYGWSITSDDEWTYLYAHCYRQFGFDVYIFVKAFDRSCSTTITVARVPRGRLFDPPRYWDGRAWQPDAGRAVPIITSRDRLINANQFEWTGAGFVSVNKEGDWWGDTILLAESRSPTGPFSVYRELPAPVKCAECNSFFATWIPAAAAGRIDNAFVISLAHNRWDGVITSLYRPTFHHVPAPVHLPASGMFELDFEPEVATAAINVVAVDPLEAGFITAYPCSSGLPLASNVNHINEPVVANLVLARPDPDGRVCLYSLAPTNLVVDLSGTFETSVSFEAADRPVRLVDTRVGTGTPKRRVGAGEVLRFTVPGSEGSEAVALNLVAVDPSAPGHLTAFPCDRSLPPTSNVNYITEPVVANLVVVPASADGSVCVSSLSEVDLVVDLAGTFADDGYVALVDSVRLADTRDGEPTRRLAAGEVMTIDVPGPAAAHALNVTAVEPAAPGFLTVYPCDVDRPTTSNVNYINVPVVANLVLARPSADGRVCVSSSAAADVVVDWSGYVTDAGGYTAPAAPVRLVDTRIGTGVPGQFGDG
ncbi:MAG: hypothetical protein ACN4IE_17250, partial [Ilumatobacter sp.]